jgi:hypothetical protein
MVASLKIAEKLNQKIIFERSRQTGSGVSLRANADFYIIFEINFLIILSPKGDPKYTELTF